MRSRQERMKAKAKPKPEAPAPDQIAHYEKCERQAWIPFIGPIFQDRREKELDEKKTLDNEHGKK